MKRPTVTAQDLQSVLPWRCLENNRRYALYKGRKLSIDASEVTRLRREEKLGPAAIARRLGIGRVSAYRLLGKQAAAVRANGGGYADQA